VFTARYALSPYIKQIRFVFKFKILMLCNKVISSKTDTNCVYWHPLFYCCESGSYLCLPTPLYGFGASVFSSATHSVSRKNGTRDLNILKLYTTQQVRIHNFNSGGEGGLTLKLHSIYNLYLTLTIQQCTYKRNIAARSRNDCWYGKAIRNKYYECVRACVRVCVCVCILALVIPM
jgi:hypothetical protein